MRKWAKTLAWFVLIEVKCLFFPLAILFGLAVTQAFPIPGVGRYDVMLVYCVGLQAAMVRRGMETPRELWAVGAFHGLGLLLEFQRTAAGAWSYPDPGLLRIGRVPLFSGFMYAGVASYLLQAWRRFGLGFDRLPPAALGIALAVAAYASFFVPVVGRPALIALILLVYARTGVRFTVEGERYRMPLALAFALVGGAIWVGENAGTFLGAWRYPHQAAGWRPVEGGKAAAWLLLVVVGFTVVERSKAWKPSRKRLDPHLGAHREQGT